MGVQLKMTMSAYDESGARLCMTSEVLTIEIPHAIMTEPMAINGIRALRVNPKSLQ